MNDDDDDDVKIIHIHHASWLNVWDNILSCFSQNMLQIWNYLEILCYVAMIKIYLFI